MKKSEKTPLLHERCNWYLLFAVILLLPFQHCKQKPSVEIRSRVKAIHAIAFIDINSTTPTNTRKVKVTLIDPGKMVLSSNGVAFDRVELSEGVMSIGLSPDAKYSAENPYHFSIRAEADGYMTNMRSITVTDTLPNSVSIFMAKLDSSSLPRGLAASRGNLISVKDGVFTKAEVLTTAFSNQKTTPLTIRIKEGTRVYNGDNKIDSKDEFSFRILMGAGRDSVANRVFPSGFEVSDAIGPNGKKIDAANPVFFTTAGWFSMEMNIGKTAVDRFSDSLEVEMPVADSVLNPDSKEPLKPGDKIPIWSLNNSTGRWQLESEVQIIKSLSGGLTAKFKIIHLSTFNLDYYSGSSCSISIPFLTSEFSGLHYSEFIKTSDNSLIRGKVVDYSSSPLEILRVPTTLNAAQPGKLYVHKTYDMFSPIIGGREDLICNFSGGNILVIGSSGFPSIRIQFVRESNGTAVVNNIVWHKPSPSPTLAWANVGNLDPTTGFLTIPQDPSTNQAFQLWYMSGLVEVHLFFTLDITSPNAGLVSDGVGPQEPLTYSVTTPDPGGTKSLIVITIPSHYLM